MTGEKIAILGAMAAALYLLWRNTGQATAAPVKSIADQIQAVGAVADGAARIVSGGAGSGRVENTGLDFILLDDFLKVNGTGANLAGAATVEPPPVTVAGAVVSPADVQPSIPLWPHQEWRRHDGCQSTPGWGIWNKNGGYWQCN